MDVTVTGAPQIVPCSWMAREKKRWSNFGWWFDLLISVDEAKSESGADGNDKTRGILEANRSKMAASNCSIGIPGAPHDGYLAFFSCSRVHRGAGYGNPSCPQIPTLPSTPYQQAHRGPVEAGHWIIAGLTPDQRLRRWSYVKPSVIHCGAQLVFCFVCQKTQRP